jgi:hypothetical protein
MITTGIVIAFVVGVAAGALGLWYLQKLIRKGKVQV